MEKTVTKKKTGRLGPAQGRPLNLPRLCADFYLLEIAVMKVPGGPAATVLERFEQEVAPGIALALEYSIASELKYANGLTTSMGVYTLEEGVDCPDCGGDYYLEDASDYSYSDPPGGYDLYCPGCEEYHKAGTKVDPTKGGQAYGESVRYYYHEQSNNGYETAWNAAWNKYKETLLIETAKAFNEGSWSSGFGGRKWGTIAEVARDYHLAVIKPRTFLDRAWTLQHNNASVFDKLYDIRELMNVLVTQADNDYATLASRWASPPVSNLWRKMESWALVYARDEGYGNKTVPSWIGTGD